MMMMKNLAIPIMLIALLAFTQPTLAEYGHDHKKGHALEHSGGEECDLHKKKECDKKEKEECELKNKEDCEKHKKKECDKKTAHGHDHGKDHALKHGGGEECDLHKKKKECDKKKKEECELKNKEDCEKHKKKECDKKEKYDKRTNQGHGHHDHGKRGFDVLNLAKEIGLSREQVKKIKDIKFEYKKDEVITNAEIEVLKITLRAMNIDYSTKTDSFTEKVREMETKKGDQKIARFNMKKEIRNLMTSEQRERVRSHFEKKGK